MIYDIGVDHIEYTYLGRIRDRSLIMGSGGLQMGGWGASEVLSLHKKWQESFSNDQGGLGSFWVVLTQELEILAILKDAAKSFHPLKRVRKRFYPI